MNRIVLVTFLLVTALSGCGKSTTPPAQEVSPPPMAAADCCQCVSPGSSTTPSAPVMVALSTTALIFACSRIGTWRPGLIFVLPRTP